LVGLSAFARAGALVPPRALRPAPEAAFADPVRRPLPLLEVFDEVALGALAMPRSNPYVTPDNNAGTGLFPGGLRRRIEPTTRASRSGAPNGAVPDYPDADELFAPDL